MLVAYEMGMLTEGKGLLEEYYLKTFLEVLADDNIFNDLQQRIFMNRCNHC